MKELTHLHENKNKIWHKFIISGNYVIWLAMMIALGCAYYFSIAFQPSGQLIFTLTIVTLIVAGLCIRYKDNDIFFRVLLIIIALFTGFLVAHTKTQFITSPKIPYNATFVTITGKAQKIEHMPNHTRIIFSNISTNNLPISKTPKKVRIILKQKHHNIEQNDIVSLKVNLMPPPKSVITGGYDFSFIAFFEQIGAVGYCLGDIKILKKHSPNTLNHHINKVRDTINNTITMHMKSDEASISSALITGTRSNILPQIDQEIRDSGLYHLLSISGLHMTIVAFSCFVFVRFLFALFYKSTFYLPTKQISAFVAIVMSFLYLMLADYPIPAVRSFIMTSFVLFAIILQRQNNTIRALGFAAIFIILLQPEAVCTPSFQMSFAATLAIVSLYKYLSSNSYFYRHNHSILAKIYYYIRDTIISSIIASCSTLPYSIYHFNTYSIYGFLSNLFAVPLTSFIIMPCGMIATLLMPFNGEKLALELMEYGVSLLIICAKFFANLKGATHLVKHVNQAYLLFTTIGIVWIFTTPSKINLYGIIFPIIAIITGIFNTPIPDIVISENGKNLAIYQDQKLYFLNKRKSYNNDMWQKYFGQKEKLSIADTNFCSKTHNNQKENCIVKLKNTDLIILQDSKTSTNNAPPQEIDICTQYDLIINLSTTNNIQCHKNYKVINKENIDKNGSHSIYITDNNEVIISNTNQYTKNRPWGSFNSQYK